MTKTFKAYHKGAKTNYALAIKGEVIAVGSKAEMMQLQKNRRRAMAPSGDVVIWAAA